MPALKWIRPPGPAGGHPLAGGGALTVRHGHRHPRTRRARKHMAATAATRRSTRLSGRRCRRRPALQRLLQRPVRGGGLRGTVRNMRCRWWRIKLPQSAQQHKAEGAISRPSVQLPKRQKLKAPAQQRSASTVLRHRRDHGRATGLEAGAVIARRRHLWPTAFPACGCTGGWAQRRGCCKQTKGQAT